MFTEGHRPIHCSNTGEAYHIDRHGPITARHYPADIRVDKVEGRWVITSTSFSGSVYAVFDTRQSARNFVKHHAAKWRSRAKAEGVS